MKLNWRNWCWILFLFAACSEEAEPDIVQEEITIFFDSESKIEIKENDPTEIVIPIRISLSQEEPITVTYELIGQEVVNESDFTLLSENPLIIPAGSTEAAVRLRINDNDIVQPEDRNIYLRFRSVDKDFVKTAVPKEVIISIEEDDCSANISDVKIWIGSLTIQSSNESLDGTGEENSSGICSGSFNVKGKFVGDQNPESTLTVILEQDPVVSSKGIATVNRTKLFDFTSQYEFEATGTYNEASKKITLNFLFYDLNNTSNNFADTAVIIAE
ncbi:MAG: hypothetical protein ABJH04_08435 [Cyclobacteriaceae bacterium]